MVYVFKKERGKKSDKETQSPLLKIFRDYKMQARSDPEKRNLLNEEIVHNPQKKYSGTKPRCYERSSPDYESERRKTSNTMTSGQRTTNFEPVTNQTVEKVEKVEKVERTDSWLNQKDKRNPKDKESSCTCGSCVLNKIAGNEFACIRGILTIFILTVIVAGYIVFHDSSPKLEMGDGGYSESERLKRKIDQLDEKGEDKMDGMESYQGHLGMDIGSSFHGMQIRYVIPPDVKWEWSSNILAAIASAIDGADDYKVSSLLDVDKQAHDMQSADKIQEFYKRLAQADMQIKALKRMSSQAAYYDGHDFLLLDTPDRMKRTLKELKYPRRYNRIRRQALRSINTNENEANKVMKLKKAKDKPKAYVIHKDKLLLQYQPFPQNKINTKCLHSPKNSYPPENQQKHPFYKNAQRIDELLDHFMNKNIPSIMSEPFSFDNLFKPKKKKCKHPNVIDNKDVTKEKQDKKGTNKLETNKPDEKTDTVIDGNNNRLDKINEESNVNELLIPIPEFNLMNDVVMNREIHDKKEKEKSSTSDYGMILSIAPIMNDRWLKIKNYVQRKEKKKANKEVNSSTKDPKMRKLMQLDGDEEEYHVHYKDLTKNDYDAARERVKRTEGPSKWRPFQNYPRSGIINPNWKGPMPLYPDELNSMLTPSSEEVVPQDIASKNLEPAPVSKREIADFNYFNDYLSNTNELLAAAQAYSDYGVLDDKKDRKDEKDSDMKTPENRVRLNVDGPKAGSNKSLSKENHDKNPKKYVFKTLKKNETRCKPETCQNVPEGCLNCQKVIGDHLQWCKYIPCLRKTTPKVCGYKKDSLNKHPMFAFKSKRSLLSTEGKEDENNLDGTVKLEPMRENFMNLNDGSVKTINNEDKYDVHKINRRENTNITEEGNLWRELFQDFNKIFRQHVKILKTPLKQEPSTMSTPLDISFKDIQRLEDVSNITNIPESDISIDKSEMMIDNLNTIKGKINLKVDNPVFGTETINLPFNFPLKNFTYNQYELLSTTPFDINTIVKNNTIPKDLIYIEKKLLKHSVTPKYTINDLNNMETKIRNKRDIDYEYESVSDSNDNNVSKSSEEKKEKNTTNNEMKYTGIDRNDNDTMTDDLIDVENSPLNNTRYEPKIKQFYIMIYDFFYIFDDNKTYEEPGFNKTENCTLQPNYKANTNSTNGTYQPTENTTNMEYVYKSRKLLSVPEDNVTLEVKDKTNITTSDVEKTSNVTAINQTSVSVENNLNKNKTANEEIIKTNDLNENASKAVFKRNADDSNLILWNDIYDEEYGIQTHDIDSDIETTNENDFLKKSGKWVQEKWKKIAANLKLSSTKPPLNVAMKRNPRSLRKLFRHKITDANDYENAEKKLKQELPPTMSFAALTKNMEEVCKKASLEVQKTRDTKVKDNSKQDSAVTTLMQRLIGMMTDLVELQVQQKTCTSLPPDLQKFLEWLTKDEPTSREAKVWTASEHTTTDVELLPDLPYGTEGSFTPEETSTDYYMEPPKMDSKALYMDSLRNVQELLESYDAMDEDEKSRMKGVKTYLEEQLRFLNNKLENYDLENVLRNNLRFKRHLRPKRKLYKFMRNFGKKHTHSTASYYDGIQITNKKRLAVDNDRIDNIHSTDSKYENGGKSDIDSFDRINFKSDIDTFDSKFSGKIDSYESTDSKYHNDIKKRNLKDVYYRALEDNKKYVTEKDVHI